MIENTARNKLIKNGYLLKKSRIKQKNINNLGGYMIIDIDTNSVIDGSCWDLTFNDVEDFINKL